MNVFAVSAADPTRFVRGVRHDHVANAKHRALEAILLHCTKASSGLREDGECLDGCKGQVGVRHPLSFDLDHPFCQRLKNLLGVNRLGPQRRGSRVMKRDGVGFQFNFEVDPVVTMNIDRNVHYRDLEGVMEEGRTRGMVFLGFRSKERDCDSCVVHRVEERAA